MHFNVLIFANLEWNIMCTQSWHPGKLRVGHLLLPALTSPSACCTAPAALLWRHRPEPFDRHLRPSWSRLLWNDGCYLCFGIYIWAPGVDSHVCFPEYRSSISLISFLISLFTSAPQACFLVPRTVQYFWYLPLLPNTTAPSRYPITHHSSARAPLPTLFN